MIGNIFKYIITTTESFRFNKSSKAFVLSLFLIMGIVSMLVPVERVEAATTSTTGDIVSGVASGVSSGISSATNFLATGGVSAVSEASNTIFNNGEDPNCKASQPSTWGDCLLAYVSQTMLEMAAWVLMVSAMLFNALIDMTLNIKDFIIKVPIVNLGWTTFRDFTNIFFIFIILYIAINTIMGNEGYGIKKLLGKTIITAVLINFSLFFTQVIVDTSNIIALQFYAKITENISGGTSTTSTTNHTETNDGGISAAFVKAVGLHKIYTSNGSTESAAAAAASITSTNYTTASNGKHWYNIIIIGLGGTVFILITSFVLVAGAFMLLIRTLTLMFLMILSPLAFLGGILPSTQGYVKQWWDTLIKNALFAPAYMALLYLVASMVLKTTGSSLNPNNANFVDMLVGNTGADWVGVLTTYVILNILMFSCIILASKLGVGGSSIAMKWGKNIGNSVVGGVVGGTKFITGRTLGAGVGLSGALARNTIGRGASALAQNGALQRFAGRNAIGRGLLKATRGVADSNFDARNTGVGKKLNLGSGSKNSFEKNIEEDNKSKIEFYKGLNKSKKDATGKSAQDYYRETLTEKSKAVGVGLLSVPGPMLGMFRRGARLAAATTIIDKAKDDKTEIADKIREHSDKIKSIKAKLEQLQKIEDAGGTLNATQIAEKSALNAELVSTQRKIDDKITKRENLENDPKIKNAKSVVASGGTEKIT